MKKTGMSLITLSITVAVLAALTQLTITSLDKGKILEMVEPVVKDMEWKNVQQLANMAYSRIYTANLIKGIRREITAKEIREFILKNGIEEVKLNEYIITVQNGDVFVEPRGGR